MGLDTKPWHEIQAHILHYHKKKQEKDREKTEQMQWDTAKLLQHKLKKTAFEGAAMTAPVQLAQVATGAPPQNTRKFRPGNGGP